MKKSFVIILSVLLLLSLIIWNRVYDQDKTQSANTTDISQVEETQFANPQQTVKSEGTVLSFISNGERNVLDELRDMADVQAESSSYGQYVVSINGIASTNNKFWLYYVNDEPATIGADQFTPQAGDLIEWRLE